jgi:hypothetical protein
MKLAAGYIVFDGLETLEASIRSIRESVDIVIVSYQSISWGNTQCSPNLVPTLQELKGKGLIDVIMEFTDFIPSSLTTPNDVIRAKTYECNKRQSCLAKALELGATHYMSIDADEFYVKSQFDEAKKQIIKEKLHATAVHYINYLTPTLHQGYSKFKVPFIYEIGPKSRHHSVQFMFSDIDPTRGITDDSHTRGRVFERDLITMHHMEMVREDLIGKYQASSRYFKRREDLPTLAEDISHAKETGELRFRAIHFGDSLSGLNKKYVLTECEDLFGLMANRNGL